MAATILGIGLRELLKRAASRAAAGGAKVAEKGSKIPGASRVAQDFRKAGSAAKKTGQWLGGPSVSAGIARGTGYATAPFMAYSGVKSLLSDDDDKQQTADPLLSSLVASGATAPDAMSSVASRLEFEQNQNRLQNKRMNQLLTYYGMVNMINPDAAEDMLKIGGDLIENEIAQSGNERQAKIFDAVFKKGAMPQTAMEAYTRVLEEGGTVDDAKEISGMIADSMPASGPQRNKQEMQEQLYVAAQQALVMGDEASARAYITQGVTTGLFDAEGLYGQGQSYEEVIEGILNQMKTRSGQGSTGQASGIRLIQ